MNIINLAATCCTVLIQLQVIVSDYMFSSCPQLELQNGKVRMRSRGRVARFRCDASYQLVGNRTATCIRGTWDTSTPLCIRNDCPAVPKIRNGYWIEDYKGASFTLVCNDGYILRGARVIYCHNQKWSNTIPFCDEIVTSCDFENEDLCGWTQDVSNFTWSRHSDATPSGHVGTGPSFDHSLGQGFNGHYMYIESSSPFSENDTARLLSPVYDSALSQEACFMFWYHMYGATTGELNVYQKLLPVATSNEIKLFHLSGQQGNQWLLGFANLTSVDKQFQVVIEGIRGRSYMSDIAIDDVKLTTKQECTNEALKELTQTTTQITVPSSPMTVRPVTVIPKTIKIYPTFLPPPPPPDLPPLPSLPYFTLPPLQPFLNRTPFYYMNPFEHPPFATPSLFWPLLSRTTTTSRPITTSVVIPTSPRLRLPPLPTNPPFPSTLATSANTLQSKIFSHVLFNSSTLFQTNTDVTVDDQLKTTQIHSKKYYYVTPTSFSSSNHTNRAQNTVFKTSPSYYLSSTLRINVQNTINPKYNTENSTLLATSSTKMLGLENRTRTTTIIIGQKNTTQMYFPLSSISLQRVQETNKIPSQIDLTTPALSLKPIIRRITEDISFHPNERTTSRRNIEPLLSLGQRTTSEPAAKIKESTAEAKVSHVSSIAGVTGGLIGIAIIAALLVFILSKRITRFKKHRDMSEDSDVRFLTSDEVLDFSLARPSEDDDDL